MNGTAALYTEIRAATDLPAAHDHWRRTRDELFAHHPASPLLPADREAFTGLRVKPYDPAWRFECVIQDAEPQHLDVETGTDGVVPFERLGFVDVPGVGSLEVWACPPAPPGNIVDVEIAVGERYGDGRLVLPS